MQPPKTWIHRTGWGALLFATGIRSGTRWFRPPSRILSDTDIEVDMALFSKRVKAHQVRSTEDLQTALASGKPVFVDFWKPDCQPCRTMDGIVDELAEEFQDEAVVLKADLSYVPDLFQKFKVRSTPTFVLVSAREGGLHQRFRHSGLIKKDQLVDQLQKAVRAQT